MSDLVAKKGIDRILLFRILSEASKKAAWKLAFQTEHEVTLSISSDSVDTKDGKLNSLGAIEYDFSCTSILAKGDSAVADLKKAMIGKELIEIWEINKDEKGTLDNADKYKATYYQGFISSFGEKSAAEDNIELSLEFLINGIGQEGYVTLDDAQAKTVQYVFKDTVKGEE